MSAVSKSMIPLVYPIVSTFEQKLQKLIGDLPKLERQSSFLATYIDHYAIDDMTYLFQGKNAEGQRILLFIPPFRSRSMLIEVDSLIVECLDEKIQLKEKLFFELVAAAKLIYEGRVDNIGIPDVQEKIISYFLGRADKRLWT